MSEFRELKRPEQTTRGWYIATADEDRDVAWLTTIGTISSDTGNMDILFYVTELEAHDAASDYYYNNGRHYVAAAPVEIIESQVMEFE